MPGGRLPSRTAPPPTLAGHPCTAPEVTLKRSLLHSRPAVWTAFLLVHLWLAVIGVWLIPQKAFGDLDLYRYWMWLGMHGFGWPGLDTSWVYPIGATVPLLAAGLGGLAIGHGYAMAWAIMVTALDSLAMAMLLRRSRGQVGGWWWTGFLFLLGPIAMGRLDAIVVPLLIAALLWSMDRPAVASALLTIGAWIKVAPGALIVPLFWGAHKPWRDVVAPAAGVCAIALGTAIGLGGQEHVLSFLLEQGQRRLQIESPGATPWVLAALFTHSIKRVLNTEIVTWELIGPGTQGMADLLGLLLPVAAAAAIALLWWKRERVGLALWADRGKRGELVVRGAMLMTLVLLVFNKVGSPQYMTWLAAPVAVALVLGLPGWRTTAKWVLGIGAATQLVFPWAYDEITYGGAVVTVVLAARNVALIWLLVHTAKQLLDVTPDAPAAPSARSERTSTARTNRPAPVLTETLLVDEAPAGAEAPTTPAHEPADPGPRRGVLPDGGLASPATP